MVTLCGGAATTRSPRPRMEMLATQCPRLRRLSGRAAALNVGIPVVGGLLAHLPGLSGIVRGATPRNPPMRASPARRRRGLALPASPGLPRRLGTHILRPVALARRPPDPRVARAPHVPGPCVARAPTSPDPRVAWAPGVSCNLLRLLGWTLWRNRRHCGSLGRVFGVLGVSVGRRGRYATPRALDDAGRPVSRNQSCARDTCCLTSASPIALATRRLRQSPRLGIWRRLATIYVRR